MGRGTPSSTTQYRFPVGNLEVYQLVSAKFKQENKGSACVFIKPSPWDLFRASFKMVGRSEKLIKRHFAGHLTKAFWCASLTSTKEMLSFHFVLIIILKLFQSFN